MVKTFFSPDASWNKPASALGIDKGTNVKNWPTVLSKYGGGPLASAQKLNLNLKDYSVPIYDAAKATTTAKCFQLNWSKAQQTFGNVPIGTSIPWNPAWKPGTGSDKIMCIVNYATGESWYLWGVTPDPGLACFDWFFGPNCLAGLLNPYGIKLGLGTLYRQSNIWTAKDGSTVNARGMGIDKAALVLRAAEVASGKVGHALALTTANPATSPMTYRKPATKLEHASGVPTGADGSNAMPPEQTLPSGTRFVLLRDRAWVENWAYTKFGKTALAQSMIVIAMAFVEYGAIIAETGGWGIGVETDGMVDPFSAGLWKAIGFVDNGTPNPATGYLDGLFDDPAYIAVVNEP